MYVCSHASLGLEAMALWASEAEILDIWRV